MNILRQLRWKMTLSYTLVTVGALLVITLILGGIAFTQILAPEDALDPEQMVDDWMNDRISSTYPMWGQILAQTPVDIELVSLYLRDPESRITSSTLFNIGALEFWVTSKASIRLLVLDAKGIILGTSLQDDPAFAAMVGHSFDPSYVPGLEAPFRAAQAGDINPGHLYTELVPNQKYVLAAPVFDQ